MKTDLEVFLNRIRILHCVDGYEISTAGIVLDNEGWRRLRAGPAEFMVEADGPTQRALWLIIERREARVTTPKFQKTYCSHCGGEFGPGNHGYSHCENHAGVAKK